MLVSRGRNPSAGEILSQLIQSKGLRDRVLTTLGLLLLVRLGIYIPMPGIDRVAFQQFLSQGGQLIGFLDIFTGGGLSTLWASCRSSTPRSSSSCLPRPCPNWRTSRRMRARPAGARSPRSPAT